MGKSAAESQRKCRGILQCLESGHRVYEEIGG